MNEKNVKKHKQLCWDCVKACDRFKCSWVDNFEYPKGVVLDDKNFILSCPLFVHEEYKSFKKDNKDILKNKLNITERTYFRYKNHLNKNLNINNEKFIEFKKEINKIQKDWFNE